MSISQVMIAGSNNSTGGGGGAPTGDGAPGSGTLVGYSGAVFLIPSTNGANSPGKANPGDTITWTINSDASLNGVTVYYWVDNDTVPYTDWTYPQNYGQIVLDASGGGSFSRTVVSNPQHGLFRMYIGTSLYQGTITHGFIGV